jgi:Uma2 family endonuclease
MVARSPHPVACREVTMYDGVVEGLEAMRPAAGDRRLTYDDFLLFPDDGKRHEIIDGEHYVTPSPNTRHQVLVGRLHFEIELCLRRHPGTGAVFVAPFDVLFSRWDIVEPDLLFIAADQMGILTEKNVQGPPALVIEILSPGTRKTDDR